MPSTAVNTTELLRNDMPTEQVSCEVYLRQTHQDTDEEKEGENLHLVPREAGPSGMEFHLLSHRFMANKLRNWPSCTERREARSFWET